MTKVSAPKTLRSRKSEPTAEPLVELATRDVANIRIEADDAESFIAEKRIGTRIRNLRLKKSMGLVELGSHTGLSASFLSQLETGRVVPTLRNLARIAMVFSKDLTYFFEPEPLTLFRPHLAKDRIRLPQTGVDDPMYFFESLGYMVPDRAMDPYLAVFPPKPGKKPRTHHHAGYEFLYVLEGTLAIQHGETVTTFGPGDAVYFDAATVHSYSCASDTPATALIVTLAQPRASSAQALNPTTSRFGTVPLSLRSEQPPLRMNQS